MRIPVEKAKRRLDGIYRQTRATIISEYAYHPVRFFSILAALVVGLGILAYFGPISAQIDEVINPENNGQTTVAETIQLDPQFIPVAEMASRSNQPNEYFEGNYEVVSTKDAIKVEKPNIEPSKTEVKVIKEVGAEDRTRDVSVSGNNDTLTIESKDQGLTAGAYKVETIQKDTGKVLNDQKVLWGVLAFNPDYAIYPVGKDAFFSLAVLDDRGKMVCTAAMTVEITDPNSKVTILTTDDGSVRVNKDCEVYGKTDRPDYEANFQLKAEGNYKVKIVAKAGEGTRTLHDQFSVRANQDFYLQRVGATRTYPPIDYDYTLNLEAKKAGQYSLTEKVPNNFEIKDTKGEVNANTDSSTSITWKVDAVAGQTYPLTYNFKTPNISPYMFTLGPAEVRIMNQELGITNEDVSTGNLNSKFVNLNSVWTESRQWLIASDNACQSNGTGGGNWSAAGSWQTCGGTTPQAADSVTILAGDTITQDVGAGVTVVSITINTGAPGGTLTVTTTNAITITGSWANNGTFTAATGTVTFSSTTAAQVLTGTLSGATGKFYNLIFTTTEATAADDWEIQAALEAANDFTISAGNVDSNSNAVTVTNDYTITNVANTDYDAGTAVLTVGRHFADAGNLFTEGTASELKMTGTGNLNSAGDLAKLTVTGTVTKTSTNNMLITNHLDIQLGGNLSTGATCGSVRHSGGAGTNLTIAGTLSGSCAFWQISASEPTISITGTVSFATSAIEFVYQYSTAGAYTIPAFTTNGYLTLFPVTNDVTYTIGAGTMSAGGYLFKHNTAGKTLTIDNSVNNTPMATTVRDFDFSPSTGNINFKMGSATYTNIRHWVNKASSTTLTPGTSTVNFTASSNITSTSQSFYNVIVTAGTATPQDAMIVTNNLTMTGGILAGAQNITVNGNIACGATCGTITTTGGTFTQKVSGSKNFGTSVAGATVWTFVNLTFSNSTVATAVTITTSTTGSGGITVSGVLTIGSAGDTAKTTFDAGNRTYTLSSTGGNPIVANGDGNGSSITGSTSTFSFTGANAGGDTTIEQNTAGSYNNITLNASDTFVLEGATVATGTVTITTGTLDTTAASSFALTAGAISIALTQTLTANASIITLTGTSGTLFTKTGTFTQGTSEVRVTSASGTPTLLSAATTFHKLTINSAATVINMGAFAPTINNVAGAQLYVQSGVFNASGADITGPGGTNGTLQIDAGATLCLGGTTASTDATSGLTTDSYTVEYSADSTFTSYLSATSPTNSFTHPAALSIGNWYFRVRATDLAGNQSANSLVGSLVIQATTSGGTSTTTTTPSTTKTTPRPVDGDATSAPSAPRFCPGTNIQIDPDIPLVFQCRWTLFSSAGASRYVLGPLPREFVELARNNPILGRTFEKLGIKRAGDLGRLRSGIFSLPNLIDITNLALGELETPGLTPPTGLPGGKLSVPSPTRQSGLPSSGVPLAQLSPQVKAAIPTEIVFAQTGNELVNFNIKLTVDDNGQPKQYISTIAGKPLQLATKPAGAVAEVTGQMVFTGRRAAEIKPRPVLLSDLFLPAAVAQNSAVETRLITQTFSYTDPDLDGIYTSAINAPAVDGEYEIITTYVYKTAQNQLEPKEVRLVIVIDPEGYVYEKSGNQETRVVGATVNLKWLNPATKNFEDWPARQFSQPNPQTTDKTGKYSFLVPEGTYRLEVTADSYKPYVSADFEVQQDRGVHTNIELRSTNPLKNIGWPHAAWAVSLLLAYIIGTNIRRRKNV